MKIIGLNGPIASGKDYIAKYVAMELRRKGLIVECVEFKSILYEWLHRVYEVPREDIKTSMLRKYKELPTDIYHGKSPREALIHMSEEVIKPLLGKSHIANSLFHKIGNEIEADVVIITDVGFKEEAKYFDEPHRTKDCLLVKLYTYVDGELITYRSNDSRTYVNTKIAKSINLNNKYTLTDSTKDVKPDISTIIEFVLN